MITETERLSAHDILDWVLNFLDDNESFPVLPDMEPGSIHGGQEKRPPDSGEALARIFREFKDQVLPGITHWNHPGFLAYFNSSATLPSVMAEMISAAVNTNSMLWKSSPAGTEIEWKTLEWLQEILGLSGFTGITFDGGSSSSFHGLAAMREAKLGPEYREKGLMVPATRRPKIYLTGQTHNSVHKALITLGFGTDSFRTVNVRQDFTMDPDHLKQLVETDRKKGDHPLCVVSTLGSTSCTAVDPVQAISGICSTEDLWLHIDAAHGGAAAVAEEIRETYAGWEAADSIIVNPHKWLFIPLELSVLYVKDPGILKNAFHFSAEYLKTREDDKIENYMDFGIPLGRRFRCLKLWFALKYHGIDFYRERIREHIRLSRIFYETIDAHPEFEIMAPRPLSTTCFRAVPGDPAKDVDQYNETLMDAVNRTGRFFVSHTRLRDRFVLRHVVSGVRIEERHIHDFISCLIETKATLDADMN